MHIKRLHDFAQGGTCTSCEIISHPNKPGFFLIKYSSEKEITEADKQMIVACLEACKAEHENYNANDIVALLDSDLSNIAV